LGRFIVRGTGLLGTSIPVVVGVKEIAGTLFFTVFLALFQVGVFCKANCAAPIAELPLLSYCYATCNAAALLAVKSVAASSN
jgi:hypothetical protein